VPFKIRLGSDETWVEIEDAFHAVVDYRGKDTNGFDISQDTVEWTNKQRAGDPIWEFWRDTYLLGKDADLPRGVQLLDTQDLFLEIDARCGHDPVWFRNVAFDMPRIDILFREMEGRGVPWHRRQQSDIYTMVNLAAQLTSYEDDRPAAAQHGALSDAVGQIDQLAALAKRLGLGSLAPGIDRDLAASPAM
jgi:hypothetical protein